MQWSTADGTPTHAVASRADRPRSAVSCLRYALLAAAALSACASPPVAITLPQGPGVPFASHAETLEAAVRSCRGIRTMELVMALRGRSGSTRIRSRVRAALARPASLRLEMTASFGASRFILAARPGAAILVLPRARQVVRDASPSELLYALAGLQLAPDDLRAVLTGCVVPDPRSIAGRAYGDEWVAVDLNDDATVFLRDMDGEMAIVAGTRGPLTLEYSGHVRGLPMRVRVTSDRAPGGTDLTAELSQVSTNIELRTGVFVARVRDDYVTITLDELRNDTPLEDPAPGADHPDTST